MVRGWELQARVTRGPEVLSAQTSEPAAGPAWSPAPAQGSPRLQGCGSFLCPSFLLSPPSPQQSPGWNPPFGGSSPRCACLLGCPGSSAPCRGTHGPVRNSYAPEASGLSQDHTASQPQSWLFPQVHCRGFISAPGPERDPVPQTCLALPFRPSVYFKHWVSVFEKITTAGWRLVRTQER